MAKPAIPEENQEDTVNEGASTSEPSNSVVDGRNVRAGGLGLPRIIQTVTVPLSVRITTTRQPGIEETRLEGQELFVEFLQDQINFQRVQVPSDLQQHMHNEQPPQENIQSFAQAGNTLRMLADEFAKSEGRQRVREVSDKVTGELQNITKEHFLEFLQNVFADNQNPVERIITLFFFCSDVIISSIKNRLFEYAKNFISWSISFIVQRVCTWVAEKGGWNVILGLVAQSFQNVLKYIGAVTIFTALVFASFAYYWKRK